MGVPCKLGEGGLLEIVEVELSEDERRALHASAEHVRNTIQALA